MTSADPRLPWLAPGEPFPPPERAWGPRSPIPGILAAGGALDVATLQRAYAQATFPWFSEGQPILWWSPNPRMVLHVAEFKLHRSLRKTLQKFIDDPRCEVRFDSAFAQVIAACAASPRVGQSGTWILPEMVSAYTAWHAAGGAHSVETWIDGELVGGLYGVGLGQAVFGESMFTRVPDASKIALAALVAWCRAHGIRQIDCQQNTRHLASLGAREVPRADFVDHVQRHCTAPSPVWKFDSLYWQHLLSPAPAQP